MGNPPYDPNYSQYQQPPDPYGQGQVTFQQYQPPQEQQYYPQPPPPPPEKHIAGIVIAVVVTVIVVTVVLAAVLYVMVIGFSDGGYVSAPVGSLSGISVLDSTSARITFGTFSPVPEPMDIKVIITNSFTYETHTLSFPSQPYSSTTTMYATGGITATYTDLNYAGNSVNAGDYIIVSGLDSGRTYTIEIFHIPSDSLCSLVGQTSFSTP